MQFNVYGRMLTDFYSMYQQKLGNEGPSICMKSIFIYYLGLNFIKRIKDPIQNFSTELEVNSVDIEG